MQYAYIGGAVCYRSSTAYEVRSLMCQLVPLSLPQTLRVAHMSNTCITSYYNKLFYLCINPNRNYYTLHTYAGAEAQLCERSTKSLISMPSNKMKGGRNKRK